MKLGGLFSGIGGFELAWTQLGHEVAWMCEIDKNARKVLEARFPGVPIYEDVEQLDPAEVEAVDVLTGGSPCQGFSVAGTRSGLEHGESRLFADYIRIMNGLAERGLKWALWENVPGVLSITNDDGERTFEHVVTALVGGTVPVRLGQGRWNTGLADGRGRAVAWRVLDSRYFGVAQRRRRVFACVAFGGVAADRAGRALLAKPEGVSGDFEAGGPSGEGVAGGVADGVGSTSKAVAFRKAARAQSAEDDESWVADGQANTLNTFDMGDTRTTHAIVEEMVDFGRTSDRIRMNAQTAATLQSGGGGAGANTGLYMVPEEAAHDCYTAGDENVPQAHRVYRAEGNAPALGASAGMVPNVLSYGVRRLTPVECERLQAFPDGWTEPAGSDSARYKALGNAVTVNTVRWVLGRMLEQS